MDLNKTVASCLLPMILNQPLQAQHTVNMGMIAGLRGENYDTRGRLGLGGSIEYVNHLTNRSGVRLYVGYDRFKNKLLENIDEYTLRDSLVRFPAAVLYVSFIPVRIGYQQQLFKGASFVYAEGE